MKKKPITNIQEAIKGVEKVQKSAYYGYFDKATRDLWELHMDELFDFYQKQIKACLLLTFKKNLTSKVTYSAGINSVRYFEMYILPEGTTTPHFISHIGIPIRADRFKGMDGRWGEYSGSELIDAFKMLQLFFDHLNDENLYKKDGNSN